MSDLGSVGTSVLGWRGWRVGKKKWRKWRGSEVLAKFTGKHLCWNLLLNIMQTEGMQIYSRLQHKYFLVNFTKFLRIRIL